MDAAFEIEHDFLTGSYARWTKTKPLKDVDIFCVLAKKHRHYRDQAPSVLLGDVEKALVKRYGGAHVSQQRRSCTVDFGVAAVEDRTDYKVMSVDVVPAFTKTNHYEIPDTTTSGWTETNPRIHYDKAVEAQRAYSDEWKGLVRMMKRWNNQRDKPNHAILPHRGHAALDILKPSWGGDYRREMQAFFATLADRIHETWQDRRRLGPSRQRHHGYSEQSRTHKKTLRAAERQAADAIRLERDGKYRRRATRVADLARATVPALVVDLEVCIDHVYTSRSRPERGCQTNGRTGWEESTRLTRG